MAEDFSTDPFTQAYNAIWTFLVAVDSLKDRVKKGNRITFANQAKPTPIKEQIIDADVPELTLMPGNGEYHLFNTSTSHEIMQAYDLVAVTGDQRVTEDFFPIQWEVFKALAAAGDKLGLSFVTSVRINTVTGALEEEERNRDMEGWVMVASIVVAMTIDREDIE